MSSCPRGYKTFFLHNSAEYEIVSANKLKLPKIVRIFIFISREIFISSSFMFSKIEFAIVSNLRIISKANSYSAWLSTKNVLYPRDLFAFLYTNQLLNRCLSIWGPFFSFIADDMGENSFM